ncbi:MAG: carboxypeptidase-like regulatory domain-containing protein, partial [bacterium]|nr:carboxypeptidase-like regulatory domain-containing protein [bacterium]
MKKVLRNKIRFALMSVLIMATLGTVGLVIWGCGGGGGGSLPGFVKETGTLSGKVALPGNADPSGSIVIATRMTADGTQPARAVKPKAGRMLDLKANDDGGSYITAADSGGVYTFTDVEKGTYFVVATKGIYRSSQTAKVESKAATIVDLALTPTGSIKGQVLLSGTDSTGDFSGTLAMVIGTSYVAATDSSGFFTLTQVPVGTGYQLMFTRPGYELGRYPSGVTVNAAVTNNLTVFSLIMDSTERGALEGYAYRQVEAGETANHEGILVAVMGTQYLAVTDSDGAWKIIDVPAGTWTVGFGDLGQGVDEHHLTIDDVIVTADTTTTMDPVTLQPTGITGTVTVSGGDPAMGAMVQIQELGREGFAIADSSGDYEILGIEPGTYTVLALLSGYQAEVKTAVTVAQGTVTPVDFALSAGDAMVDAGTLSGTVSVTDGGPQLNGGTSPAVVTGYPLEQAYVQVLGTNYIAVTDRQGLFSFKIPKGTYDVLVESDHDGLEAEQFHEAVVITKGETTTLDTDFYDDEHPHVFGMMGISDIREDEVEDAPVMRVFFSAAEDVSAPVTYGIFYNTGLAWDQDNWANNQIIPVIETAAGVPEGEEDVRYYDVTGLDLGVEYVFGVRADDTWGNITFNDMTLIGKLTGGADLFPPVWEDEFRQGVQAAYSEGPGNAVAVEFDYATDEYDEAPLSSDPVIYRIYFAQTDDWDFADWSNNNVRVFSGDMLDS